MRIVFSRIFPEVILQWDYPRLVIVIDENRYILSRVAVSGGLILYLLYLILISYGLNGALFRAIDVNVVCSL